MPLGGVDAGGAGGADGPVIIIDAPNCAIDTDGNAPRKNATTKKMRQYIILSSAPANFIRRDTGVTAQLAVAARKLLGRMQARLHKLLAL